MADHLEAEPGSESSRDVGGSVGGQDPAAGGTSSGMSIGAGMGGFQSYDPEGPISTSMDDTGSGSAGSNAGRTDTTRGSTGGRSSGSEA